MPREIYLELMRLSGLGRHHKIEAMLAASLALFFFSSQLKKTNLRHIPSTAPSAYSFHVGSSCRCPRGTERLPTHPTAPQSRVQRYRFLSYWLDSVPDFPPTSSAPDLSVNSEADYVTDVRGICTHPLQGKHPSALCQRPFCRYGKQKR